MAYCTQADVEIACGGPELLVQAADLDGDGYADTAVIDRAIARADSLMNTYLAKKFTVPVTTTGTELRNRSAEIAAYFLRKWRGTLTQDLSDAHEADKQWLVDVAEGRAVIDQDPMPTKHSMVIDQSSARPASLDVSRRKLRGFW